MEKTSADRGPRRTPWIPEAAAAAAIAAAAVAVRWFLGVEAPLHTNANGISDLRSLVAPDSPLYGGEELFGQVYPLLMRWLISLFRGTEAAVFGINEVLGGITVLPLYLLARGLHLPRAGCLAAALLFALHPGLVWLSSSESPMAMHMFLLLSGLALIVWSAQRENPPALWTGAALLAVAGVLHVFTILALPVAALLFRAARVIRCVPPPADSTAGEATCGSMLGDHRPSSIVHRRGSRLGPNPESLFLRDAVLAATGLAILFGLHAYELRWAFAHAGQVSAGWTNLERLLDANLLLDPTLTPVALAPLALVGAVRVWLTRRRLAVSLLLALLVLAVPAYSAVACRTEALRYQAPVHWLLCLLAAGAFDPALLPGLSRTARRAALAAVMLAAVAASAVPLASLGAEDLETAEYLFIRATVPLLPPDATIRVPDFRDPSGTVKPNFPDFLADNPVRIDSRPAGPDHVWYLGLQCWWHLGQMGPEYAGLYANGIRNECLRTCPEGRFALHERTLSTQLPTLGYQRRIHPIKARSVTLGFYRCNARSSPSPGRSCVEGSGGDPPSPGLAHVGGTTWGFGVAGRLRAAAPPAAPEAERRLPASAVEVNAPAPLALLRDPPRNDRPPGE